MAQVIRYVDPDAAGAGTGLDWTNAYTSLSAWNTAEATNLVTAGDYHTVYCRSSGGTNDTTPLVLGGWTLDTTHYLEIIGADFPVDGVFDATKYVLAVTNDVAINVNRDSPIYFINLQIQVTTTGTGTYYGIYCWGASSNIVWYIDSCIIKGVCSGTGTAYGTRISNNGGILNIYNTVVSDFVSGADTGFVGISNAAGTINVYNSTVYNCYYGAITGAGALNLYNCAIGNCTDDINGAGAVADYCCTDDGDGTNGQSPSGGDWANEFTTPGTDFSLKSGANCIGNGTDNPGAGLYSDDIIGTARSSTWDIGAFEYAGAPPAAEHFMTPNRGYW